LRLQDVPRVRVSIRPAPDSTTLKFCETEGRILRSIEQVNKVANIAFRDRKDLAAQFNALLYGVQRLSAIARSARG
jgi:hypothetical protein